MTTNSIPNTGPIKGSDYFMHH